VGNQKGTLWSQESRSTAYYSVNEYEEPGRKEQRNNTGETGAIINEKRTAGILQNSENLIAKTKKKKG